MNHLHQKPYSATLMGCVIGVSDYYGLNYSPAMLYGLTGHAFLINIHRELCPSGPYVWNHKTFYSQLKAMGLAMKESPFYTVPVSKDTILTEDKNITASLKRGSVSMITSREHQLIEGYDDQYFSIIPPWEEDVPSQITRLDRQTWKESLESAGFIQFTGFQTREPPEKREALIERALTLAHDLFYHAGKFEAGGDYRVGFGAYENWINAIKNDKADLHGHWWNGMVWAECRRMGADFFREIGELKIPGMDQDTLTSLVEIYFNLAGRLDEVKEKKLEKEKKILLLSEALELEHEALDYMLKIK